MKVHPSTEEIVRGRSIMLVGSIKRREKDQKIVYTSYGQADIKVVIEY